ncbi:glutathione-regulated potassium-efflux system oxidoreductase KefF [Paucibacter soli]|uniref:glutathione-regulated potassium-efflux system oxidoreductase KefF n=1 Tax=Paucibacter soli TaxID=3133433 RepID=UPI0030A936D9
MNRILILCAHPDLAHSLVTRRMLAQLAALPPGSTQIACRDLYALYPDYVIDVAAEQQTLREAELLVWLHPLHWYGMPALLKLWVDEVFGFGWAYGPGGNALCGKDLWLVSSTGGAANAYREDGYNHHPIEAFLLPYVQTARLCGLRFLPPLFLHGAHRASEAELQQHASGFVQQLLNYPNWCGQPPGGPVPPADRVPGDERPAPDAQETF